MNKLLAKLIASVMALTVAASLVVMSSYAWLTISSTPEVNGIQINLGASNTIMVAADMTAQNEDGTVSHYPGVFGQTLQFDGYSTYSYLDTLAGLMPVSTADGVNWILPSYYNEMDEQVRLGLAVPGQMKAFTDFYVDNTLSAANLTAQQQGNTITGNYIYLDFWVVAPVDGYTLRVSTGNRQDDSGSFVITRMEPTADENGVYTLAPADETAASFVRIGFLTNHAGVSDADMHNYMGSDAYNNQYLRLQGRYQESGEMLDATIAAQNGFVIYEPNGNLHSGSAELGTYSITKPLGIVDGKVQQVSVEDRLTVQLTNKWKIANNGLSTLLQQEFETAVFGLNTENKTPEQMVSLFYRNRLQGVYMPYIDRGAFVKSTANLYASATDGTVAADAPALHMLEGATEDVMITVLAKNVPQRIRMFIWLEGQDIDCTNQEIISNLIVNLELAGSNR